MSDNPTVSNSYISNNPDIPVRGTELTVAGANNKKIVQHFKLDIGTAAAESVISLSNGLPVAQSGTWTIQPGNTANTTPWLVSSIDTPGTPTQSSVAASASSVSLLAANASRKKVVIFNDSTTANLFVRLNASAATNANYTYKIFPQCCLEEFNYVGEIRGIWSAASGNARVTEYA